MARRTLNLALSLALAGSVLWGAAPAMAKGGLDSMQKWWNSPHMVEELKLTSAEKERLDQLFMEFQRSRIENKSRVKIARLEIEAAFEKEPLDEARAQKAFQEVEQAKLAKRKSLHAFMLEVRQLLGQERYLRLKELYKEYKAKAQQTGSKK
jgi:Spy/CpxP family protein refolding chaperone